MEEKDDNKGLFCEFTPAGRQAWEDKIREDLKGADFGKKLVSKTCEGFDIYPIYTAEDLQKSAFPETRAGSWPYIRGNRTGLNSWRTRQDIEVEDAAGANRKATGLMAKGVNSLGFLLPPGFKADMDHMQTLLNNIPFDSAELNFVTDADPVGLVQALLEYKRRFPHSCSMQGSVEYDPLGFLTITGSLPGGETTGLAVCSGLVGASSGLPAFRTLMVNGRYFHEGGSSLVQEIAFALAMGSEYLFRLTDAGLDAGETAKRIKFHFAAGSDYFMEIAKFRAARLLWAEVVRAFGVEDEALAKMNIHCTTSRWNMTVYDPWVNMLRTTTESMSSIIGGVDSLTTLGYDAAAGEGSEFGERIGRNQQLILKEESYLDRVTDPAAGSYYIETLTASLAGGAWKIFLAVEDEGGYLEALRKGIIQKQVHETASGRNADLAVRRSILLGANQYPDFKEKIDRELNRAAFFPQPGTGGARLVEPIMLCRGASPFEYMRYQTDRYSLKRGRPVVFMLTIGNLAMRRARAQFACNFFAVAGFDVRDNAGFDTPAEGVRECLESKASIAVICSSDQEYPSVASDIVKMLDGKAIPVIAGYPKDHLETLRAAGIRHFIHIRSNILESLRDFQKELGII
jgi:methylmalonyl-CoA mutase